MSTETMQQVDRALRTTDETLIYCKRLYITELQERKLVAAIVKVLRGIRFFYNLHVQESGKVKGIAVVPISWTLDSGQLQVKPAQAHFITSNLIRIAEVQFYPDWGAYAIYIGDQMVGFTMIEFNENEEWWISSLMIAAEFQGKAMAGWR